MRCPNSISPCRLFFDHGRFIGGEWCAVDQHAMQDHSKLARKRDLGLVLAGAGSQAHGPALEGAGFYRPGQNDVRCFLQNRADTTIADLGDPPARILLARLITLRCQAEMGADLPGTFEAYGIVDRRGIGQ